MKGKRARKKEGRGKKDLGQDDHRIMLGVNERVMTKAERRGLQLQEMQLILSEKRTSLSLLRTGITIFVLPLSVLTFLVATSGYYDILDTLAIFITLMGIVAFLLILGLFFTFRAFSRIRMHDERIARMRKEHRFLEKVVDEDEILPFLPDRFENDD